MFDYKQYKNVFPGKNMKEKMNTDGGIYYPLDLWYHVIDIQNIPINMTSSDS